LLSISMQREWWDIFCRSHRLRTNRHICWIFILKHHGSLCQRTVLIVNTTVVSVGPLSVTVAASSRWTCCWLWMTFMNLSAVVDYAGADVGLLGSAGAVVSLLVACWDDSHPGRTLLLIATFCIASWSIILSVPYLFSATLNISDLIS